jgi:Holliday junction DNA helicase RuvA
LADEKKLDNFALCFVEKTISMIEYIKGEITDLTPAYVVVESNGVGYFVNISLNTYTALSSSSSCKIYIYEAIREDAYVLYGFSEKAEREKFMLLISVSGIGANTARMILSSLTVSELETAIATGNVSALKSIKGIGAKTAERAIVDLKDKISKTSEGVAQLPLMTAVSQVKTEALSALTMLGFKSQDSSKVLDKIFLEQPSITVEEAIKKALKML